MCHWTQSRAGVVGIHRPSASSEAWRSGSNLSDSGRKSYGGLFSDSVSIFSPFFNLIFLTIFFRFVHSNFVFTC
ncbi:unnamed protein product [Cuscuta campestris]|uniref:Uncharacterized protein n=1 Tax=Cuscuta campestris TaxID=132261 RepID=A0A484MFL7_9ASTE|nr:unnamed protein product [Cuscuta campestris]